MSSGMENYVVINYKNGNRYEGELNNDLREGQGTLFYSDGDRYEGEWENDKRHGFGKLFLTNGSYYEGEWIEDYINGFGKFVYSSGVTYEGDFQDTIYHGDRANGYIMENLETDCQMDQGSDFIPMVKKSMENGMKEYFVFNMTFTYIIGIGDY